MEPYQLSLLGLSLDCLGAFLVAAETTSLEVLRRLMRRFRLKVYRASDTKVGMDDIPFGALLVIAVLFNIPFALLGTIMEVWEVPFVVRVFVVLGLLALLPKIVEGLLMAGRLVKRHVDRFVMSGAAGLIGLTLLFAGFMLQGCGLLMAR